MAATQSIPSVKAVSLEDRVFLNRLNALNFGPIVFKLMHSENGSPMSRQQAEKAIKKYKMFLFLTFKYPNGGIVPNQLIDKAWHAHLLDSELYDLHCLMLFNRKLHHFPYFGLRGVEDAQLFLAAAAQSKVLFEQHFGAGVLEGDLPNPSLCCDGYHSGFNSHDCTNILSMDELANTYIKQAELLKVRPIPEHYNNDVLALSLV